MTRPYQYLTDADIADFDAGVRKALTTLHGGRDIEASARLLADLAREREARITEPDVELVIDDNTTRDQLIALLRTSRVSVKSP